LVVLCLCLCLCAVGKRAAAAKAAALCGSPTAVALLEHLQASGLSAATPLQPGRLTSKEVEALQPLQLLTHVWVSEQQGPVALLVLLPPAPASAPHQPQQQQSQESAVDAADAVDGGLVVNGAPSVLLQLLVGAVGTRVSPATTTTTTTSSVSRSGPAHGSTVGRVWDVLQTDGSPVVAVDGVVLPAAGSGLLEVLLVRSRDAC
jgi:hypothetical protein